MDTTTCPDCGALAEVTDRFALESTDGPIEHVRVQCVARHWFLMPTGSLARHRAAERPAVPAPRAPARGTHLPASRADGGAAGLSRPGVPRRPRLARRWR